MSGCPVATFFLRRLLIGRPTLGFNCAAGGRVKRDTRRHAPCMKNAPGLGPRQRRQVRALLGGMRKALTHIIVFSYLDTLFPCFDVNR